MNDDSSASPTGGATPTEGLPSSRKTDAAAKDGTPKRSGTFIYPLPSTPLPSSTPLTSTPGESAIDVNPAGGVGAGTTNEGTSPVSSTSTNGTTSSATTDTLGTATPAAGTPSRRNSMGVASVRIAARLAHTEMSTRASRGTGTHADPTIDNDELLMLLGEYLIAGGLEKPEIHASLGGQPIVVDLQSPQRYTR